MKGSDYMLIGLTFITGMFAGGFLYVSAFFPNQIAVQEERSQTQWEINAVATGDCSSVQGSTCPRFVLASDRSYTYAPYSESQAEFELREGKIRAAQKREIEAALDQGLDFDLSLQGCESQSDAGDYDYRYDIRYNNERVVLSNCAADFAQSTLGLALQDLWSVFATTDPNAEPVIVEEGIKGFLQDRLEAEFQ